MSIQYNMEDSIKFLNENNIDWCVIPTKNKKTDWSNTGLDIVVEELYDIEEIKIACDKYVEKKLKRADNEQTPEFLKKQFFGVSQNYFANPVMLKPIQTLYEEETQFKKWTIICDTSNVIQLDIDVNTEEDYNKLSTAGKKLYNDIKKKFPFNKSQSKPCGYHSFIIDKDNADLSAEIKKILNYKNQYGETEHYKNNTQGKYLKKDFNFIEVICGNTLHLSSPIENNKYKDKKRTDFKPLVVKTADNILKTIFVKDLVKNVIEKTPTKSTNVEFVENFDTEHSIVDNSTQDKQTKQDLNLEEITGYLNNIKQIDIDNRDTFFNITCAVVRDTEDRFKQTLYELGKKSPKSIGGREPYDIWFEKHYNNCKIQSTFKNCNILRTLSRNCDIKKHYEIYNKYSKQSQGYTPQELSDIFLKNNEDNIIVANNEDPEQPPSIYLWVESHKKWTNETNNKMDTLCFAIYEDIFEYLKLQKTKYLKLLQEARDNEEENMIDKYERRMKDIYMCINDIQAPALRKNIATCLIQKIKTLFPQQIEFDNEPTLLPFKDCLYDLSTQEIRDYKKTDLIIRKIDYDYREPLEDNYNETKQFLYSLFPIGIEFKPISRKPIENRFRYLYRKIRFNNFEINKKSKKWKSFEITIKLSPEFYDLIYVLCMSLFGYMIPTIHILNGEGCNGKSVLMDIMKRILCIYFTGIKGNNLCEDIETNGASPHWAKCDMKRIVVSQEPNENKELCVATLKYITEQEIEARMLYSNKTKIQLQCIWFLVCNVVPELDGVNNNALTRRIKDFNFPHKRAETIEQFINGMSIERCEETGKVINCNSQFMGVLNTKFADKHYQEEAKYSLLKYLLNFVNNFENIYGKPIHKYKWKYSNIVEERSKAYLGSNDRINEHLNKYFRKCVLPTGLIDKTKYITLNELHTHFITNSEFYKQATQRKKDKYKKQVFFKNIKENDYGIFVNLDKEKRVGGQRVKIGQVLEGFELIPNEPIEPINNQELQNDSDTDNDTVDMGYVSEYSEDDLMS